MPMILRARPGAFLTIAGFGPDEALLRQEVETLSLDGHVRFIGAVEQSDLPDLYRRAAVFVAPFVQAPGGDQEGLGLVTVEAAGCGCPVVAGDVAAVHDVVDHPVIGTVVDPSDTQQLAAAVLDRLGNGASAAASGRDRARAVSHFDWGRRSAAYAALLRSLVPETR